jgi:hypothetical protein
LIKGWLTPRSAKVVSVFRAVPFRHRCDELAAHGRAVAQHMVARLPVGKIDRRDTAVLVHESSEAVARPNF